MGLVGPSISGRTRSLRRAARRTVEEGNAGALKPRCRGSSKRLRACEGDRLSGCFNDNARSRSDQDKAFFHRVLSRKPLYADFEK